MKRYYFAAIFSIVILAMSCSQGKTTATTEATQTTQTRPVANKEMERINSIVGLTDEQKPLFEAFLNDIAMKEQQVKGTPDEAAKLKELEGVKNAFYSRHFTSEQTNKYKNALRR